jgi:hypothetical protein
LVGVVAEAQTVEQENLAVLAVEADLYQEVHLEQQQQVKDTLEVLVQMAIGLEAEAEELEVLEQLQLLEIHITEETVAPLYLILFLGLLIVIVVEAVDILKIQLESQVLVALVLAMEAKEVTTLEKTLQTMEQVEAVEVTALLLKENLEGSKVL